MANPEIFPISQLDFAEEVIDDMVNCHVFVYGSVVFTVCKDFPVVHLYADESGHGLFEACRIGLNEVWEATGHQCLFAPILNQRVKKLARRFGWLHHSMDRSGYEIFYIQRRM